MGQQVPMSHPHIPLGPSRLRECTFGDRADWHDGTTAQYLRELRQRRDNKPSGSRPPPPSKFASLRRTETAPIEELSKEQTNNDRPPLPSSNSLPVIPGHNASQNPVDTAPRIRSPFAGRPLARPPSALGPSRTDSASPAPTLSKRPSSMMYMENGRRWMEKEEAKSLRAALEDMDFEEEKRVHSAAQEEAAELVFKHKYPGQAYKNPDAAYANPDRQDTGKKDYRSHLRRGSYQRRHSHDQDLREGVRKALESGGPPSVDHSLQQKQDGSEPQRKVSPPSASISSRKTRTPSGKSYGGLAEAVADDIKKAQRRTSSGNKRIMSGEKKPFMNPNDRIWEDPQEKPTSSWKLASIEEPTRREPEKSRPAPTPSQPPASVRKNPFARVRMQQDRLMHSNSAPALPIANVAKHHNIEIQKNPPSQSRNAWYTSNPPLPPTPPSATNKPEDEVEMKGTPTKDTPTKGTPTSSTPTKNGLEIRGDDIRAATSKQRKDRSSNLPQPTMVSDKPGRPIVSFQSQPKEKVLEEVHTAALEPSETDGATAQSPLKQPLASPFARGPSPAPDTRPPIPKTVAPNEPNARRASGLPPIPILNLPDEDEGPSVTLPEEPDFAESTRPLPNISARPPPLFSVNKPDWGPSTAKQPGQRPLPNPAAAAKPARPLPHHAATSPLPKSTPHYTPTVRQSGVLCAQCALPITGRILSAAGQRFHPNCFTCHECHTNLELVAFYPEPDNKRAERIERIRCRQAGIEPEYPAGISLEQADRLEYDDGDETPRFYCHLDFHEIFSPRCKSCKTPIEGQVIVACGAEYHEGHFFCAQCGDPFDASTPFVEKDGYAWCVGCHTHRYSSKCRKCRKPVTELVVKALGWDWHEDCFVCLVSDPLSVVAATLLTVQQECNGEFVDGRYFLRGESEDPVCVKCEEKRLKA